MERIIIEYHLIDSYKKETIRVFKSNQRKRARRMADRLDLLYGAVRYIVRPIFAEEDTK